jgi:hypothetical protein
MFCLYTIFFEKKNYDANISDLYPDPVGFASFRRIQIRLLQLNLKLRYTFPKKFQNTVQIIRNYGTYQSITQKRKKRRCQLAML